jgi:hypothetical protein
LLQAFFSLKGDDVVEIAVINSISETFFAVVRTGGTILIHVKQVVIKQLIESQKIDIYIKSDMSYIIQFDSEVIN